MHCFLAPRAYLCSTSIKATSRSQGKIAQCPKKPMCIYIIRVGIGALNTGPLLLQAPTGMPAGGAICAANIKFFNPTSHRLELNGTVNLSPNVISLHININN